MWPFKKKRRIKPVLKDIWFDIYTTDGNEKIKLDSKLLYDVLTIEQVEFLNSLVPERVETAEEIFKKKEKELVKEETKRIADSKRKYPIADEINRLNSPEDYKAYLNNNKDKAVLTPEEDKKLHEMLENIGKHRHEVEERIEKAEKSGKAMPGALKYAREFNEFLFKSAENGKKQ